MAVQFCDVEVFVLVNSEGEYVAHESEDSLAEVYGERIGELSEAEGTRRIRVTVKVPLPKPIELTGAVVAVEEEAALKVA